jgi:DNA (cytosine-5)-methyltransferase 1
MGSKSNSSKHVSPVQHRKKKKMTEGLNSFFAGIGGFDLGFQQAGIKPLFHCELNSYCLSVLERHWPDVAQARDIRAVNPKDLPEANIWCGGFPCQDVSVARGSQGREGLKGKNSGLFFPFIALVEDRRPKVVLLENVVGLLSSHEGRDFLTIISSLTSLGYSVAWRVLNTRYLGAPQSRPRVFICAWRDDVSFALHALYEAERAPELEDPREGFLTPYKCAVTKAIVPEVSYCLAATSGRHTGTDWSRSYVSYYKKVRRLTPTECEGLQGFPAGWSLPSEKHGMSEDDIDTLRYHALGNAVSTPVVKWIASRISEGLSGNVKKAEMRDLFGAVEPIDVASLFGEFLEHGTRKERLSQLIKDSASSGFSIKWRSGGIAIGEADLIADQHVSPAPASPIKSLFVDILEKREAPERYYLSPNAAEGILRRVNSQGRVLFAPLHDALLRLSGAAVDTRKPLPAQKILKAATGNGVQAAASAFEFESGGGEQFELFGSPGMANGLTTKRKAPSGHSSQNV